jgi:hypothetical protein
MSTVTDVPKVRIIRSKDHPSLDPVTTVLIDTAPGKGQLIVECFGMAWSSTWPAMGEGYDVARFVRSTDVDYLVSNLMHGRRQFITNRHAMQHEEKYLERIVQAVKEALEATTTKQEPA